MNWLPLQVPQVGWQVVQNPLTSKLKPELQTQVFEERKAFPLQLRQTFGSEAEQVRHLLLQVRQFPKLSM